MYNSKLMQSAGNKWCKVPYMAIFNMLTTIPTILKERKELLKQFILDHIGFAKNQFAGFFFLFFVLFFNLMTRIRTLTLDCKS